MTTDSQQRGTRSKKEDYISSLVQTQGKIRVTDLYGLFSKRFQGTAIRTFLNEYLPALEYRGEIALSVEAAGYYALTPEEFDKQQAQGGRITR